MAIPADPWFARPEPKKRERAEWFEDVLRAGREAEQVGDPVRKPQQPSQEE